MKKLAWITGSIGVLIAVFTIIACVIVHDWRWIYGAAMIGVVFLFASAMSLWSPAGDGGMGIYTRRYFREMYRDKPRTVTRERKASNQSSLACFCIGLPNILIPIIVEIVRNAS